MVSLGSKELNPNRTKDNSMFTGMYIIYMYQLLCHAGLAWFFPYMPLSISVVETT